MVEEVYWIADSLIRHLDLFCTLLSSSVWGQFHLEGAFQMGQFLEVLGQIEEEDLMEGDLDWKLEVAGKSQVVGPNWS